MAAKDLQSHDFQENEVVAPVLHEQLTYNPKTIKHRQKNDDIFAEINKEIKLTTMFKYNKLTFMLFTRQANINPFL